MTRGGSSAVAAAAWRLCRPSFMPSWQPPPPMIIRVSASSATTQARFVHVERTIEGVDGPGRLPHRRHRSSTSSSSSASASSYIFAVGTVDTKGAELEYLADKLRAAGAAVRTVDVSANPRGTDGRRADVPISEVMRWHPDEASRDAANLPRLPRAEAVADVSAALREMLASLHAGGSVSGVVGIGGSGGTSLISAAMRELPIGVPKHQPKKNQTNSGASLSRPCGAVLVSTVAAGNVAAYVGESDLVMMPSVVDVAGLNSVSTVVLDAAAGAIDGMARSRDRRTRLGNGASIKPAVGLTMFGVTTPCVEAVRASLESRGLDPLVFHATGAGGRAMEGLVRSAMISACLDVTTTEVADEVVGGVMAGGPRRLEAAIDARVPLVVSTGAMDMVNFGARDTVPDVFRERRLYVHNEQVTLMRTSAEENEACAAFIARKLAAAAAPTEVLLPEKGVSALDAPGMPFHDPEATGALHDALEASVRKAGNPNVTVRRLPHHINDPAFAEEIVQAFLRVGGGDLGRTVSPTSLAAAAEARLAPDVPSLPGDLDPNTSRGVILPGLYEVVASGAPIVGAGAGTGISAKCEADGGAHLIVIYNSGRFRMAGRGSLAGLLPYADANGVVMEMASEVLPVVSGRVPVLAGVCGTDPFRDIPRFLRTIRDAGFAGVQNFPTVGLFDGTFRRNIEETGMGFDKEVEMIAEARRLGLLTTPYAFTPSEAEAMARAGADVVVAHVGLTTAGSIGAATCMTLEEATSAVQAMSDAARAVNPHVLVLCHGGPIATAADARHVLTRARGVHGFYGASSMERLPVETAIAECVREFVDLRLPSRRE